MIIKPTTHAQGEEARATFDVMSLAAHFIFVSVENFLMPNT
jgi:hypothetical protein